MASQNHIGQRRQGTTDASTLEYEDRAMKRNTLSGTPPIRALCAIR